MQFSCALKRLPNGNWTVRHSGTALGTVEVSGSTREAALAKMRDELRYRVELCPCSGVSDDYVQLLVTDATGAGARVAVYPARH